MSQSIAQKTLQFVYRKLLARFYHDHGCHLFTQPLLGQPEHDCFVDVRVFVDSVFYFLTSDILSSPNDQIFKPIFDVDKSILIDKSDISGLDPAIVKKNTIATGAPVIRA